MNKKKLITFVLLAYGISWLMWMPNVLAHNFDVGWEQSNWLPITNPLLIWLLWCFFYGLGEEGGWRGLLFPELTKHFQARIATLYVAFIWVPWHLPVFFYDKDLGSMGWFGTMGWVVGLVFGSLLLGWLVKQAGFNLWPVILWHGTFNFFTVSDQINPLFPGLMTAMVIIIVMWIARRSGENLELEHATG